GIAAAAVGHATARIGDGTDMIARGIVMHANSVAVTLGGRPGLTCREAAARLQQAVRSMREPPPAGEGAFLMSPEPPALWALDSASLVGAEHVGTVVATGS